MGLKEDLAAFEARLNTAIADTMETDVLDVAKAEIINVLNGYDWTKSRGNSQGSGGLRDIDEINATAPEIIGNTISITITDDADFQDGAKRAGDTLDEVVAQGDPLYYMPYPRPFMEPAEEALGKGTFESALEKGLRNRGFDI